MGFLSNEILIHLSLVLLLLIGAHIWMIENQRQGMLFFLVQTLYHGVLITEKLCHRAVQKAEYRGIVAVLTNIIWLLSLLNELHSHPTLPKKIYDNLGALLLSANPIMHSRTKHFQLDMHFAHDYVQKKRVSLIHHLARYQVAEMCLPNRCLSQLLLILEINLW